MKHLKHIKEYVNFLHYIDGPAIKGVNKNIKLNLVKDEETSFLFFRDVNNDDIIFLNKYLKENKFNLIELYHATSSKNNILGNGLLTTKLKSKKSLQSTVGYVYLSVFENMAKTFGKIAYPNHDIKTYKITVPVYFLKPDLDQLSNKRLYSHVDINNTLAESALFGYGFRIKGNIPPYMIEQI